MTTFPYDGVYTLWSDELARQATITVPTGTVTAGYGVARLIDDNPATLFRTTSTTVRIVFDHLGVKTAIAILGLIHATTEIDDDVRLQGDDAADWVTPDFDAAFQQAGWAGAGVTRWPLNPVTYPDQFPGYDPYGYEFHSLVFGLTTPLAQNLELGQIKMHPTFGRFAVDRNVTETRSRPRIDNRTAWNVSTKYSRGTTLFRDEINLGFLDDPDREALAAQVADVDGGNQPWLYVPDGLGNRCHLGTWATPDEQLTRMVRGVGKFAAQFEELGRGLRPGV